MSFGRANPQKETIPNTNINILEIPLNNQNELLGTTHYYLFDPLSEKCEIELKRFETLGDEILSELESTVKQETPSAETQENSQISLLNEDSLVFGQIGFFGSAKPSEKTAYLLIDHYGHSKRMTLNLSKLSSYAIFSGQIVALKVIRTKSEFFACEMMSSVKQILPKTITNDHHLNFSIASGPFTHSDNMDYLPLKQLLRSFATCPPDVLILVGPIIDANHNLIIKRKLQEDIVELFSKIINMIQSAVANHTHIIIMSSPKDVLGKVYPTFAFANSSSKIHYIPDPSIVSVNDISIGMTSVDCLSHILEKELHKNPHLDKIKRSVNHLFSQKSFYPLSPAHKDVNIDSSLGEKFLNLNFIPNIMILPGTMNCFVRVIIYLRKMCILLVILIDYFYHCFFRTLTIV